RWPARLRPSDRRRERTGGSRTRVVDAPVHFRNGGGHPRQHRLRAPTGAAQPGRGGAAGGPALHRRELRHRHRQPARLGSLADPERAPRPAPVHLDGRGDRAGPAPGLAAASHLHRSPLRPFAGRPALLLGSVGWLPGRLRPAADLPLDSLLAVWRGRVLAARPEPVTLESKGAWVALSWGVIFGLLALRSTRWR